MLSRLTPAPRRHTSLTAVLHLLPVPGPGSAPDAVRRTIAARSFAPRWTSPTASALNCLLHAVVVLGLHHEHHCPGPYIPP